MESSYTSRFGRRARLVVESEPFRLLEEAVQEQSMRSKEARDLIERMPTKRPRRKQIESQVESRSTNRIERGEKRSIQRDAKRMIGSSSGERSRNVGKGKKRGKQDSSDFRL